VGPVILEAQYIESRFLGGCNCFGLVHG